MAQTKTHKLPVVTVRLIDAPSFKIEGLSAKTPARAAGIVARELEFIDQEYFGILNLNSKLEAISFNIVSIGDSSFQAVSLRESFKGAVLSNAAGAMVIHNHPSGDYTLSPEDIEVTKKFVTAAGLLGIRLIDHIIVAGSDHDVLSMRVSGVFPFSCDPNEVIKNVGEELEF